ncbi:pimeloyl-ACP methyl ester carboxylesterase [Natranaerovirga hydrolytica]|uniref:Pimeloyl-ACP methyl ester carboxylesterase n=1 Tax=Natranaerovirga hydrolytica TaxID=680378 RepID=A0A4R1N3B0_9FIRM|nr:alpha/beta hydrolase [Natranaerovirga hydrolytica]TCK98524.1 pimeloyl-ACP methyl ester carboxylesterase [Natranaerovirga hydrolytica]
MYYKNNIGSIYYEVHGQENATTIVFSHGVTMDHRTFKEQVNALKDEYRVIVWDMPYHGKSSEIHKNLQFSTTAADFIIELLDSLDIPNAILSGLSLGSFVTQQAAYKYPDRVVATIHLSGGSLYPKCPKWLKVLNPVFSLPISILSHQSLAKHFAKHKAITPHTIAYLEEGVHKTGKKALMHLINEMINDMVIGLPEPLEQPMLITYGDHELSPIKKMNKKWHHNSLNSQLSVVENAHHILNQDNPEECNKVLLYFLKSLA